MGFSVNDDFSESCGKLMIAGLLPEEFKMTPDGPYINEQEASVKALWSSKIFLHARRQLLDHIANGGSPDKEVSPDCCRFGMKKHNHPLTLQMAEAGWTQWQSTVITKAKEQCAEEGVKFKRFRYAVHYWVSPNNELALGKLTTQGKFIPDPVGPEGIENAWASHPVPIGFTE